MLHVPALRRGQPYYSLATAEILHHRTHEPMAELSQLNGGLVARELYSSRDISRRFQKIPVAELIEACRRAADSFMNDTLPLGETEQAPEDYVRQLSGSTGLPEVLCRANMQKIYTVLSKMEEVLNGLTRGLDLAVLDRGVVSHHGSTVCFVHTAERFGAVLPSNSPGVHSLWLPAVPLKTPLALKPGREEPWTPYRIIQAFIRAGVPKEVFSFLPCDHAGAGEILRRSDRSMLFGGGPTVDPYRKNPNIEIHGPGWSKIILGEDVVDNWEQYPDVLAGSILTNGGRSCVNASGIWVPRHAREIAEALAERLARVEALPAEHPEARLAAFARPEAARSISGLIDRDLKTEGAEDVTARHRGRGRFAELDGCAYLLPTVIHCESPDHPLANREYLFPFASVVPCPQAQVLERIGPTLVVSAVTEDEDFIAELMAANHIDRLNIGPIMTCAISWDQPHEGNLFEHLYKQRSFDRLAASASA